MGCRHKTFSMRKLTFAGSKRLLLFVLHACAWILYGYWTYANSTQDDLAGRLLHTLNALLPFCFAFYSILYLVVPYKKTGYWYKATAFLLVFLLTCLLAYCFLYMLPLLGRRISVRRSVFYFGRAVGLRYLEFFAVACIYRFVDQSIYNRKEIGRLRVEVMKQELEIMDLKEREARLQQDKMLLELAQVPPHFLYNTLSLLVSRALEFNEQLANNIAQITAIIRYSLDCIQQGKIVVPLQQELENLQYLIQVNQFRSADSQLIAYSAAGDIESMEVPPLSLITVVENAFKYGDLKDPAHPLQIKVQVFDDRVYFRCRNKKHHNTSVVSSHKMGVANLQKQLELSFKEKHRLDTLDENDFYTLELTLYK